MSELNGNSGALDAINDEVHLWTPPRLAVSSSSKHDVTPPLPSTTAPSLPLPSPMPDDLDYRDPEEPLDQPDDCPPNRRKLIHRAGCDAWTLVKRHPRSQLAAVTLTPMATDGTQLDSLEAQRRLRRAYPVLHTLFSEWIIVSEIDEASGRWHFHGLAAARQDIARGWCHQPYEEVTKVYRQAKDQGRPLTAKEAEQRHAWAGCLSPNRHLRTIWQTLREQLPGLGFGSVHPGSVTPLQDPKKAIAYMLKGLKTPSRLPAGQSLGSLLRKVRG